MSSETPVVSVVMPAYNAAPTIEASMHSVLMQEGVDLELLVIDDGSSDQTREIVHAAARQDTRIVPIMQSVNGGVATARNTGMEAARGRLIAFLDSDDSWHPGKLGSQVQFMQSSGCAICYAPYRRVDQTGRLLSAVVPPPKLDYAAMLRSNRIGNLTAIYDRSLGDVKFQRIGHEDYAFWLDMVRRAGTAHRLPTTKPVADYLVRGGSLSSDKWRAARWQWNIYRDVAGLDLLRASWYFANYAAIGIGKRY